MKGADNTCGSLKILRGGPGLTLQDNGRKGFIGRGLGIGGAADTIALEEARALLDTEPLTTMELTLHGTEIQLQDQDVIVALTGGDMNARCDGEALKPYTTHKICAGSILTLSPPKESNYGYLTLQGLLDKDQILGSSSAHLAAGIGSPLMGGDVIPFQTLRNGSFESFSIQPLSRSLQTLHLLPDPQSNYFDRELFQALEGSIFMVGQNFSRAGIPLEGNLSIHASNHLDILSDFTLPGDIQILGDGSPYILMNECQTMGGYPRIGHLADADRLKLVQARPGTPIRFRVHEGPQIGQTLQRLLQQEMHQMRSSRSKTHTGLTGKLDGAQLIDGVVSALE